MIMDEHKWGFALEEAVREVECEIHKKEHKEQKQQRQRQHKWGIVGRIFIRGSGSKSKKKTNDQKADNEDDDPHNAIKTEIENNNETAVASPSQPSSTLQTPDSPIVDLKKSCNSPIMSGSYSNRRRTTTRKTGVAERNETERKVVYKTLKNYNQINKLHDYDLVWCVGDVRLWLGMTIIAIWRTYVTDNIASRWSQIIIAVQTTIWLYL